MAQTEIEIDDQGNIVGLKMHCNVKELKKSMRELSEYLEII